MLQWATCDGSGPGEGPNRIPVSDRKLRLWCATMSDLSTHDYHEDALVSWREGEPYKNERPDDIRSAAQKWVDPTYDNEGDPSMALRTALLREIIGNPWRPVCWCGTPHGADPQKCAVGKQLLTRQVLSIARRAYDEQDFGCLPILADALEEGGCENHSLLRHLRGLPGLTTEAGPHVRGCWAIDCILGKN